MSAPPAAVFDRLRKLVAIDDPGARETKTVTEVFTGNDLTTIPVGTADDVVAAFQRARAAQVRWAERPVKERCVIIDRFRELVADRRDHLMDIAQAETGKARSAAQEDVLDMIANARYYTKEAADLLAPKRVQALLPGIVKTVVNHHPKGVIGVIAPWNYPMALSISDAIPALLAGNAVVVKPDSLTPFCTLANAELLYEAGLPPELFAVVPGPGSVVGSAIVDNCDYLMFTGSSATGATLAEQCGRRLIGFSAELGGKNPMIVTKDADLPRAAKAALRACFSNAGQLCIAIERIYVEREVAEQFTAAFTAHIRGMTLSTAYDFSADMGSLISEDQMKTVVGHVEDAKGKGAKVIAGGHKRPDIGPTFFEPTVLTDVTDEMDCARNETFGPVVSIYPVDSVEEAIEKANDSEYGLNASVWAGSKAQGEAIAARLRTGTVNVDEGYALAFGSTAAPMGGMKSSGVGRRHGPRGHPEIPGITNRRHRSGDQSRPAARRSESVVAEGVDPDGAGRAEAPGALTLADRVQPFRGFLETGDQFGDDVGDGPDLVHPADDLTDRHRHGSGIRRLAHPLMRLADQDVLQGHRQRLGSVGRIPGVGPPALEQPGRLAGVDTASHGVGGGGTQHGLLDHRTPRVQPLSEVVLGRRQERRAHPHPLRAQRECGRDLPAGADPAGGEHRGLAVERVDDLRPQHHRADLAGVATGLVALGDDDVHTVLGMA